jgi:YVTN family beta-propeller protein
LAFWHRKRIEPAPPDAQGFIAPTFANPPASQVSGEGAGELSWAALRTSSDLFSWFGLQSAPLHKYDAELRWVSAQPARFREFVDLRFGLDTRENVAAFQIAFDRAWLDGPETALVTAADLARSVLASVAPVDPELGDVANDLMLGAAAASEAPVLTAGPPRSAVGGPEIAALVDTFTNQDAPLAIVEGRRQLSAQNIRSNQRTWFVLSWGAPGEVPAETYRVTATIPVLFGEARLGVGIGTRPWSVAVDPGSRMIYTAGERSNTVSLIDADARAVTTNIPVGDRPYAIAVDPGSRTVYTANQRGDNVSVIDLDTRAVTATIPVGARPCAVAVDPTTRTVYVGNRSDATLSMIDADTCAITGSIAVPLSASSMLEMTIALDPASRTVYVAAASDYSVWAFDCDTGAKIRQWTLASPPPIDPNNPPDPMDALLCKPVGGAPMALATDPDNHAVYVALANQTLLVIDPSSSHSFGGTSILVGRSPQAIAVDPDIRAVYVANRDDNTVSVIDSVTRVVTATIPVGQGPRALAVDPATHCVYTVNCDDSTVSVIAPTG